MAIPVKCPNPACGKQYNLKEELAGKTVRCAACKQPFEVPDIPRGLQSQALSIVRPGAASGHSERSEESRRSPDMEPRTPVPDVLPGQKLGHYLVQEKLGAGGMAVVYKGRDLRLDKTVAIKLLKPVEGPDAREFSERFLREARAAAKVDHANVLPVYFIGADAARNCLFIVMQCVDGGTVEDRLRRQGVFTVKDAARIVRDVALALCAAQAQNITHRDIKPSNVMLTTDDHVLVADFGLAKFGGARTTLTGTGFIVGTPAYMAPEQAAAQPVDTRSDLYSLGAMFYHMVTGTLPYHGDNPLIILNQHANAPVPDPKAARPDVDEAVRAAILRLMAKRPEDRYQTAAELVQDLNVFLGVPPGAGLEYLNVPTVIQRAPAPPPPAQPPLSVRIGVRRRSGIPVVAGVTLVLVILLALGLYLLKTKFAAGPALSGVEGAPRTERTQEARTVQPSAGGGATAVAQGNVQRPSPPQAAGAATAPTSAQTPAPPPATPPAPPTSKAAPQAAKPEAPLASSVQKAEVGPPPQAKLEEPAPKPDYDNVYVATAATGDKIPHPLSKKTSKMFYQGKRIEVPEGMVYVPAGKFQMGAGESEHEVYLDAFFIGKYEVTNAEWKAFTDATGFEPLPWQWKGGQIPEDKENYPVVRVSWEDVQKYCEWVSGGTGREATLPTEAQWEKAARGPKGYIYPWGNTWDKSLCNSGCLLHSQFGLHSKDEVRDFDRATTAWKETSEGKQINDAGGNTTPVGAFPKGRCFYGCYDMAGNVLEWCSDWFMTDYYRLKGASRNPEGPTEEQAQEYEYSGKKVKLRVLRGGCWLTYSSVCRATFRYPFSGAFPSSRLNQYGFRLVVALPPAAPKAQSPPATPKAEEEAKAKASATSAPVVASYDDVYVAAAATGDKIPHPLSKKTTKIIYQGKRIDVPEGMVFIPEGSFIMGGEGPSHASPPHRVSVKAFFMDKYEVTNAQYMEFVKATGHSMPQHFVSNGNAIPSGRDNHPVNCVSWEDATAYCSWCDKRLPTEAEWEKAATWDPRRNHKNKYPWGDQDNDRGQAPANYAVYWGWKDGTDKGAFLAKLLASPDGVRLSSLGGLTTPVGTFPKGVSPYKCFDMAGNVWEWVDDWFDRYPGNTGMGTNDEADRGQKMRVLRGGCMDDRAGMICSVIRAHRSPISRLPCDGFRCAADYPWKPATMAQEGAEEAKPGKTPIGEASRAGSKVTQFDFKRQLFGTPSTVFLNPKINVKTGEAAIGGLDTQRPSTPFTFDWGDGTIEPGWFPREHVYSNRERNYMVRVTAHYPDGKTDVAEASVRFRPPAIVPVSLPSLTAVTIPDKDIRLVSRVEGLVAPKNLTRFDESFFSMTPRATIEHVLSAAAKIQLDLCNGDVCMPNGDFHQVVLRAPGFRGMSSHWYTAPVCLAAGDHAFQGTVEYSSLFHEIGHNFTLNSPSKYGYGGKIDGSANAIYSETMAQIFAHATAFEMINDPGAYGLSHEIVMDIKQSAVASMRVVRNSYEQYVSSGKRFCSWNQPNTPTDETFGAFMTVAYEFFVHAERSGGGYRTRVKRMMKLLQVFNDDLRQRYSQFNDTPEAGAFRATLMVAALSYAFSRDLRTEFRGLSFPINNETYTELYNLAHSR